ncbi:hypothetical protein K438DRAFT_1944107 [Mycena galopus ATCC 62051]|nr:hypothetical protein K438DRAFT_1944107 [Mycena galopus ATCC 62051]
MSDAGAETWESSAVQQNPSESERRRRLKFPAKGCDTANRADSERWRVKIASGVIVRNPRCTRPNAEGSKTEAQGRTQKEREESNSRVKSKSRAWAVVATGTQKVRPRGGAEPLSHGSGVGRDKDEKGWDGIRTTGTYIHWKAGRNLDLRRWSRAQRLDDGGGARARGALHMRANRAQSYWRTDLRGVCPRKPNPNPNLPEEDARLDWRGASATGAVPRLGQCRADSGFGFAAGGAVGIWFWSSWCGVHPGGPRLGGGIATGEGDVEEEEGDRAMRGERAGAKIWGEEVVRGMCTRAREASFSVRLEAGQWDRSQAEGGELACLVTVFHAKRQSGLILGETGDGRSRTRGGVSGKRGWATYDVSVCFSGPSRKNPHRGGVDSGRMYDETRTNSRVRRASDTYMTGGAAVWRALDRGNGSGRAKVGHDVVDTLPKETLLERCGAWSGASPLNEAS